MFGKARSVVKFFFYGLLIGIFFAPRSGAESRSEAVAWAKSTVKSVMGGSSN